MVDKITDLSEKSTINCGGRILDLSEPKVMAILNLTPDSFYGDSRFTDEKAILAQVETALKDGAAIIDIGGASTRPDAELPKEAEELQRVLEPIRQIKKAFPEAIISIDTFRAKVAEEAINAGAEIINDVSAGQIEASIFDIAGKYQAPYILMHSQGIPATKESAGYKDLVLDIIDFFVEKIEMLKTKGVHDIILDPGFGFSKSLNENYELLKKLDYLKIFNLPVLTGISRKSMVCKLLEVNPEKALNGTSVLHTIALLNGAKILRAHDVREAMEAIKITSYYAGVH